MAIRQVKTKEATKDGRTWMVDLTYRDYLGRPRRYHSKKFATRREAKDHEAEFKINIKNITEFSDLTFKELSSPISALYLQTILFRTMISYTLSPKKASL